MIKTKFVIVQASTDLYWARKIITDTAFTAYIQKANKYDTEAEAVKELEDGPLDMPDGAFKIEQIYKR